MAIVQNVHLVKIVHVVNSTVTVLNVHLVKIVQNVSAMTVQNVSVMINHVANALSVKTVHVVNSMTN